MGVPTQWICSRAGRFGQRVIRLRRGDLSRALHHDDERRARRRQRAAASAVAAKLRDPIRVWSLQEIHQPRRWPEAGPAMAS